MKKILSVIIQARLNSSRFPNKIIKKVNNNYLIEILIKRLLKSKHIDNIYLATSKKSESKLLEKICNNYNVIIFKGSEHNVLSRYISINKKYKIDYIARITADCPLIDPYLFDKMYHTFRKHNLDFISNNDPPTFPDGFDIEIFKSSLLNNISNFRLNDYDKEHVTPVLKRISNKIETYKNNLDLSKYRITVDEEEDLINLKKILSYYNNNIYVTENLIIQYLMKNQKKLHPKLKRNFGSELSYGIKTWSRANKVILNGNNFFSKRPDLYDPISWPSYFSKSKGCHIWDLENKKYLDATYMGIGAHVLGYANRDIDQFVIKEIKNGNMTTLNSNLEIELAERLIELDTKFTKVKFVRGGAEASSLAIRLARCASNKNNIAFCGYHGWQDWYLSANLRVKNNLNNHLFSGISTDGINHKLSGTSFPFEYNNYENFLSVIKKNNIGVVIMEVERNLKPINNFMKKIQKYCNQNNIILIFDECTSGFKETFGGIYKKYKLSPDIVVYGKALGNGYAINAVLMKEHIANEAKQTFTSSTFWSEKVGVSAGIKTLNEMNKIKSWEIIKNKGLKIKESWKKIANENNLDINIFGIDSMPNFSFPNRDNQILKQYLTAELLKKNILANFSIYLSTTHKNIFLDKYLNCLYNIFKTYSKYDDEYFKNMIKNRTANHFRNIN